MPRLNYKPRKLLPSRASAAAVAPEPAFSVLAVLPALRAEPSVDCVFIPRKLRSRRLASLAVMPVLLRRILLTQGYEKLGELHGLRLGFFRQLCQCRPMAVVALEELLQSFGGGVTCPELLRRPTFTPASLLSQVEELLACPPFAKRLEFAGLPLSVSTKRALSQAGLKTMGDLDGLPVVRLRYLRGWGVKTLKAVQDILRRAEAGEFTADAGGSTGCRIAA